MTTDLSTAGTADAAYVMDVEFDKHYFGGSYLQLNDTDGNYMGW